MGQLIGSKTTYQMSSAVEDRLVRLVIDDEIGMLEPDVAPLITLLNEIGGSRRTAVDQTKIEWFEDDYVARWGKVHTTTVGNTDTATTIVVVDATVFNVGDVFVVAPANTATGAGELCRVTTIATSTLTVTRGFAGSTVNTINASSYLRLIGDAHEEGGTIPSAKTTAPKLLTTNLQIVKTVIDLSNTAIASKVYGANSGERMRLHKKALAEHKQKLNGIALWGRSSVAWTGGPNGKPLRTATGIDSIISTNIYDCDGTLTRKALQSFARSAFRYGKTEKILLCAPIICDAFSEWGNSFLQTKSGETKWGMKVTQVETAHGTFQVVRDWMLENQSTYGWGGVAYALDLDQIEYLYLSANGENRDTKLEMNVVQNGTDSKVDQIISECGFRIRQEKYHAKLANVTDYAA